jgi:lysophospholipase L1-like esterase
VTAAAGQHPVRTPFPAGRSETGSAARCQWQANHRGMSSSASPSDAPVYVALGDSISIDDYAGGPGRGAASLLLHNRDQDFPDWTGRNLTGLWPGTRLLLLATDGANSITVVQQQLLQLVRLGTVPTLATLTIGGNDLLQAYGDRAAVRSATRRVIDNGRQILSTLRDLMGPSAPIVVGTVYDPSDGTGRAELLGLPPWADAVELLAGLNRALLGLADEHGALVADLHGRFLGHGVLAGDVTRPDPRPSDRALWYCNVIEPNAWGASAVRASFWDALQPHLSSAGSHFRGP